MLWRCVAQYSIDQKAVPCIPCGRGECRKLLWQAFCSEAEHKFFLLLVTYIRDSVDFDTQVRPL
jgi:hypothetical protein